MSFIFDFINSTLVFLYSILGSLGWTIILFTAIVRLILLPLTLPSIRAQKKMLALKPEIMALKTKHGKDKKAMQLAQVELYKKYNINPLAGCIPQLVQLGLLIVLYHALTQFLGMTEINGTPVNVSFLWLNLSQKDSLYIIPVAAALTQLVLSLMIVPATETPDEVPNNSSVKKVKEENKKEEDVAEMAATMQQQMMFVLPVMTGIFAATFPSGLGLYWVATTVFSIVQQYAISGPGGLVSYGRRLQLMIATRQLRPTPTPPLLETSNEVVSVPKAIKRTATTPTKVPKTKLKTKGKKKSIKRKVWPFNNS